MQASLTRHRLASYPPDVMVSVPKNAARTLDMHRAAELIELGRSLATDALGPHLEALGAPASARGPEPS